MAPKSTNAQRSLAAWPQRVAGRASDSSALSFDRWLDEQLAALYRGVLDEPLPDDLAQVVARLERKQTRSGE